MTYGGSSDHSYPNEIKQISDEIQRFESVHPYIYQTYSLIGMIENRDLRDQLERQIVRIEDAFIRSQEWTLTRNVESIHLV
jgi:hypothetical protein